MVVETLTARYVVLSAELAGAGPTPLGILLEDAANDALYVRLRHDWTSITDEEEHEVLSLLEDDLEAKAREMGAQRLLEWLEENASSSIVVSDRQNVLVDDFERVLNRLYRKHIPTTVRRFETHLPRYSLQVAAGKFLENEEVTEQSWAEAPPELRLTPDMFVAEIV